MSEAPITHCANIMANKIAREHLVEEHFVWLEWQEIAHWEPRRRTCSQFPLN